MAHGYAKIEGKAPAGFSAHGTVGLQACFDGGL